MSSTTQSLTVLQGKINTPSYIKPKGRHKHTGTLWPSKQQQQGVKRLRNSNKKENNSQPSKKLKREEGFDEKENLQPIKHVEGSGDKENPKATRNSKYGKSKSIRKNERNLSTYKIGTPAYKSRVLRERERELRSTGKKGVNVYDSARTGDLSENTLDSIAAILNCQKRNVYLLFPEVQQQTDSCSCGVFALAYAYKLAEGKNPCKALYPCGTQLRSHLYKCFQEKKISSFQNDRNLYIPCGQGLP